MSDQPSDPREVIVGTLVFLLIVVAVCYAVPVIAIGTGLVKP